MTYCKTIGVHDGTKSQKLMSMIQSIERDKIKKQISTLSKNKTLVNSVTKMNKLKDSLEKAKEDVRKAEKKLGIKYETWHKKYQPDESCRVPKYIQTELQNAQDLQAMGKLKEATIIWDDIIKIYKIGKR